MIDFTLSIDLGKKERNRPKVDSCSTDRPFIAAALRAAAEEVLAATDSEGTILDDTGFTVGDWKIGLPQSMED